ncbi:hypothetical protein [Sulfuricurvum sp.]|uniref:hypothetical protein n=1 Tax=Sulfuricurvum sp. TaxID=2025608 RepID=UPI0035637807
MKTSLLFLLLISAVFIPDASAYADMTQQATNAAALNMTLNDYTFSMANAGLLTGFMFGMFLWKAR